MALNSCRFFSCFISLFLSVPDTGLLSTCPSGRLIPIIQPRRASW